MPAVPPLDAAPEEEEEEERGSGSEAAGEPGFFNPQEHFVVTPNGSPTYNYSVLNLTVPVSGNPALAVPTVVITEIEHQLLIAIPSKYWHRTVASRLLPPKAINKAISAAVVGSSEHQREEADPSGEYIRIWIGFLNPEWEVNLATGRGFALESAFPSEKGQLGLLPFADALVAVADDKFSFLSAESGHPEDPAVSERLAKLEEAVVSIKDAVLQLSQKSQPPQPQPGAKSKATPALRPPDKNTKAAEDGLPGLDPAVVRSALQAGIGRDQLQSLSQFLGGKKPAVGDVAASRGRTPKVRFNELGEVDEEDAEGPTAEPALGAPADAMQAALLKLTTIAEGLTKSRKKLSLEDWSDDLPALQDSSSSSSFVGGSSRKHAAVLASLRKALKENPSELYRVMESRMLDDFGSAGTGPGEPSRPGTFRGWAEHRSRIPNISGTVRLIWAVCGALDSLRAGRVPEAQARLILLLGQVDQVAVDRGQWVLAAEGSLEETPPFSSFSRHSPPDFYEGQHTKLWPPAWAEAFMHKVRETDDFVERRSKLGKRNMLKDASLKEEQPLPKASPKKKGKGGKKGQTKNEEEVPEGGNN